MQDEKVLTGGSLGDLAREYLEESAESASAYLAEGWLTAAMRTLRDIRHRAGLTQGELAQRLHTTQSAVARLERDHEGRCSLRHYVEYLAACGIQPFALETTELSALREFALANPGVPRTVRAFTTWRDVAASQAIDMIVVEGRERTIEARFDEVPATTSTKPVRRKDHLKAMPGGLAGFELSEALAV